MLNAWRFGPVTASPRADRGMMPGSQGLLLLRRGELQRSRAGQSYVGGFTFSRNPRVRHGWYFCACSGRGLRVQQMLSAAGLGNSELAGSGKRRLRTAPSGEDLRWCARSRASIGFAWRLRGWFYFSHHLGPL